MPTSTDGVPVARSVASGVLACALMLAGLLGLMDVPAQAAPARLAPVVLIAVPDLRWSDVPAMPTLRALMTTGAVGELSVKSEGEATRCGDALLQLSAGTRVPSGVVTCNISAQMLDRLRARYRHSRYGARVGLLGDTLPVESAAVGGAAGTVLAGTAAPAHVVGNISDALAAGKVVVTVDTGIYDAKDRELAASQVDSRLATDLRALPRDATVVVAGISDGPRGGPHLHPIVIAGPEWTHHELTSPTTGRAPYVQLFDLPATLLSIWGITDPPDAMSGRAVRLSTADVHSLSSYADTDRHARRALSVGHPTFSVLCGVLIGALVLLFFVPSFAGWPAALLVAAPLATWLIQLVPWWRWPLAAYVGVVLAVSLVGSAVTWWARRSSWRAAVVAVPAATALVLLVDQLAGGRLQLSAPFGDNPLVAGRFHGMGNIAFGVTMSALLLVLGVVAAGRSRRAAAGLVVSVGLLAIVIDGAPSLGDDIGGVVTLVPALAVLLALVAGVRLTWRKVVAVAVAAVAVAVAIGLLDYARPQAHQTHAGRFVDDVLHGRAWTTVHRRADAVLGSFGTPAVAILVLGAAVLAVLVWRRRLRPPIALPPELGPPAAAVAVLAVVGSLLNDSGVFVAAGALLAFVPAAVAATVAGAIPGDAVTPGDTGRL